jgi:hypothetical protein
VIPPAAQREGIVLPRTVTVTVVDAFGSTAQDQVSVMVDPVALPIWVPPTILLSPNDDSNGKEVGIEWVNKYTWCSHLHNNHTNARGFYNKLGSAGWTKCFDWGDSLAWEEDFKYRYGPQGGTDFVWIDAVDFAFFSGHGSPTAIAFEVKKDVRLFSFDNARWGGTAGGASNEQADLEWIVLDACQTLAHTASGVDVFARWDQAFDGLHYVLGFHTTCSDDKNRGKKFAQKMKQGWSVRDAWIYATQHTEGNSKWGAYLRADSPSSNTYNDHLPGFGWVSPDPYPPTILWYCKWSC